MSQTKTTWNHPSKRNTRIWFFLGCVMILCFSPLGLFCPEERTIGGFCYLAGLIIFTLFLGHRAYFHSDEWFQAREEKWKLWWGKHPRLEIAAGIIGWVAFIAYFAHKFISVFYKH